MFAGYAVEQKEISIPGHLREQLALLALKLAIENNRRLASIVIVSVVWSYLVGPHQLSGIRI